MTALEGWLQRTVPATAQERSAALWSFAYFFTLLAGYYVLRPLRDQMGIAGGVKNLPWLFTATFLSLLVVPAVFTYIDDLEHLLARVAGKVRREKSHHSADHGGKKNSPVSAKT